MTSLPLAPLLYGRGQGIFDRPSCSKASLYGLWIKMHLSCPLSHSLCLIAKRYNAVTCSVIGLFRSCCPPTIVRAIPLIVVYSVQRINRARAWPHIFIERFKGYTPPPAYFDTARAIFRKIMIIRVLAALNHSFPSGIFRCPRHPVFFTVFICQTPTTSCGFVYKMSARYNLFPTTVTSAKPISTPIFTAGKTNNDQLSESHTGKVFSNCLRNRYNFRSHFRTPNTDVMRGLMGVRSAYQSPLFYHIQREMS